MKNAYWACTYTHTDKKNRQTHTIHTDVNTDTQRHTERLKHT